MAFGFSHTIVFSKHDDQVSKSFRICLVSTSYRINNCLSQHDNNNTNLEFVAFDSIALINMKFFFLLGVSQSNLCHEVHGVSSLSDLLSYAKCYGEHPM